MNESNVQSSKLITKMNEYYLASRALIKEYESSTLEEKKVFEEFYSLPLSFDELHMEISQWVSLTTYRI